MRRSADSIIDRPGLALLEAYLAKDGAKLLSKYEKLVKDNHIDSIYFPIHVNNNHWIAGFVHFRKGKIGYGDSLTETGYQKPAKQMEFLKKWIQIRFNVHANIKWDSLKRGSQSDFNNCGVVMINAIAHNVFGDSLWTTKTASRERLDWFNKLAHPAVKPPTEPPPTKPLCTSSATRMSIVNLLNTSDPVLDAAMEWPEQPEPVLVGELGVGEMAVDAGDSSGGPMAEVDMHMEVDEDATVLAGEGTSKSAVWERNKRQNADYTEIELEVWRHNLRKNDSNIEFDEKNHRQVRHSKCSEIFLMKHVGDMQGWKAHLKKCKGGMRAALRACMIPKKSGDEPKPAQVPCPGLSESEHDRIPTYLYRTAVLGAGGSDFRGMHRKHIGNEARESTPVRYALGVLSGEYNQKMFEGMMTAIVQLHERDKAGKGKQNFSYEHEFAELCEDLNTLSPEAYRALAQFIPMPTQRHFQKKAAKSPRLPATICDRSFTQVKEQLDAISYDGLSCDDTKLFPALQLVYDSIEKLHFLVGGVNGPLQVANPNEVETAMDNVSNQPGAKLRLWVLTIPYPKIPSIIVACQAIANDLNAPVLADLSLQIIRGLISKSIQVISYSCDGSNVERASQRLIVSRADSTKEYRIINPREGAPDTVVTIPVFDGQPVARQNSKHALKTFRNNLYSGARLLTLGNYVAIYDHIQQLAYEEGSPLYVRDVDRVDRQDDHAASRLFSADVLKFFSEKHPEYLGDIIYLFIFGELIDAYQNRSMTHPERINIGYTEAQHTISKAALDIARIIAEGLLALVFIHRDHLSELAPLLPWLHSTESCEHVFGEARRIIDDFPLRDFVYMSPKLRQRIRRTIFHSKINPKARATRNLILLHLIGITPSRLRVLASRNNIVLPSISSWMQEPQMESLEEDDATVEEDQSVSAREALEDILKQDTFHMRDKMEAELTALRTAAFAPEMEDLSNLYDMNDITELHSAEAEDNEVEDFHRIQQVDIVDLHMDDEASKPFGLGNTTFDDIDLSALVQMRREHQTDHASKSGRIRKNAKSANTSGNEGELEEESPACLRIKLVQRYHELTRQFKHIAQGTGLTRLKRWQGDHEDTETVTGNAANAASTAKGIAAKAATRRKNIFIKEKVPCVLYAANARITELRPLVAGDFVFVVPDPKAKSVAVGKVVALYSKTAGKNARNASVKCAQNISALSRVAVQIYERIHAKEFTASPTATSSLATRQFVHTFPYQVLCLLGSKLTEREVHSATATLQLADADYTAFKQLSKGTREKE
ncbi:hypothetical protein FA15DRAFT_702135 [Coprinopsis marcescibilis]|uniref:Ubiquitin-like protease family profile domain-containing protein n=1 Tax=Coprinopsis marcescibilis TaxID=230819 RepID=A0A5C3L2Q5_COPMA|nr:hypothetical protein FA15DRAFT_702135 [Coprinopsis marcescibilis]